jgi:hypothetical protein
VARAIVALGRKTSAPDRAKTSGKPDPVVPPDARAGLARQP